MFGHPPATTTGAMMTAAVAMPPAAAAESRAIRRSGAPVAQIASATAGATKIPCALVSTEAAIRTPASSDQPDAAAASAATAGRRYCASR